MAIRAEDTSSLLYGAVPHCTAANAGMNSFQLLRQEERENAVYKMDEKHRMVNWAWAKKGATRYMIKKSCFFVFLRTSENYLLAFSTT